MGFEERWIQHVLRRVQAKHSVQIRETLGIEVVVPTLPFPRVSMEEAYRILGTLGHTIDRGEKGDLDPEGERMLSARILEETGHQFVFVTDYPTTVRPFYHMRYDDRPTQTKSFDLLFNGLEITTGAQREHRYERLLAQVKEKGLTTEPLQYYLDFFRYGCPPHGGFGFGLSRLLMMLLGFKNVREVTYLYRGLNRLSP
jgi:aspartyl-tRNA synthetase